MAKTKITHRQFYPYDGATVLIARNKYGETVVCSHVDDEDIPIKSEYIGQSLAEFKARIKLEKKRISYMKKSLKAMRTFYDDIAQMRGFDPDFWENKAMQKYLANKQKEIDEAVKDYKEAQKEYMKFCETRTKTAHSNLEKNNQN